MTEKVIVKNSSQHLNIHLYMLDEFINPNTGFPGISILKP